jgi:delta24-sterol reductase
MSRTETEHLKKVKRISKELKVFFGQNKKIRIYHGSTNSTRKQTFDKQAMVSISDFDNILSINTKTKTAIVEPNVPMDDLVKATLQHGLIPPVVMEFPGITVGGGIQGGAGESSSYKYGAFHHTCSEYELVLADGTVIIANPQSNADLYWGTACSYGSLGIITKITIPLLQAKKYVKLTYSKLNDFTDAVTQIEKARKKQHDFIDAILYSRQNGILMTGEFSGESNLPTATFSKATDDWFYTHARQVLKNNETWSENIPLEDYLFRYNRGGFWVGKYPFTKMGLPFNRITRFLLNGFMDTRTLYRMLHAVNISQRWIIQDVCLPANHVVRFLNECDTYLGIYPLWLCPGKFGEKYDKLSPGYLNANQVIDVGVWGKVQGDYKTLFKINRNFEKNLAKLGGRKVLYAHQYYPENEFWNVYDKTWYTKLRKKYKAETVFPDIYEKTKVKERYDFSVRKGLLEILKSPFKLPVG